MLLPVLLFVCSFSASVWSLPNSCDSPVYCYGDLLHTVQMSRIFNDSKTFVDLKMKNSENQTLYNFNVFITANPNPTKAQVKKFVADNFEEGKELEEWKLPDFRPRPNFVDRINNSTVKKFTLELIKKWPGLARHVKDDVNNQPERYSLIPVPNGFIVPGGRFREYYYWDSYWIIDGLLLNEMPETARGMIDNFLWLVNRYGFIPNGGRVYYLQRSQPPLLTPMAALYYDYSKNVTWLRQNIDTLVKELNYWVNQTITIQQSFETYTMAQYNAPSRGPRPESYREDFETTRMFNATKREQAYTDLKSGAESGWDFSNRWIFDQDGGNVANLSFIETRRIIPVDLNAFLCGSFRDLAHLYEALNDTVNYSKWNHLYLHLRKAINDMLWNESDGIWYDYDLKLKQHRRYFYPSGVTPLWAKCFEEDGYVKGQRVLDYLLGKGVLDYLGGIPTSEDQTGEQWDFPNAWPPLQDIVVRGLLYSKNPNAIREAHVLAERWVQANVKGFHQKGVMFEKYDAVVPGQYGGGGEYDVQEGFGWTNGLALRFIHDFYTTFNDTTKKSKQSSASHTDLYCGSILVTVIMIIQTIIK